MANCSWCNKYISDKEKYWYKNVFDDGKEYKSKEIFCSAKCSHEYPYAASADKSSSTGGCILVLLIVGALIYFSNSNSSNDNSNKSNTEQTQTETKTDEIIPESDDQIVQNEEKVQSKDFEFTNNRDEEIYLAYAIYNNSNWESHGWFKIDPKSSRKIYLPDSFTGDEIYWYAMTSGAALEWAGSDKSFCIHSTDKFDYTGSDAENCQEAQKGFIKLNLTGTSTSMCCFTD